jgi:predicted lipase
MRVPRLHALACKASYDAYAHGELGDTFIEDDRTDAQVCVGRRGADRCVVIAFRGSSSWTDWTYNIDVRMVASDSGHGRVHSGFQRQWLSIRKRVVDLVDTFDRRAFDAIVVCGHSLGSGVGSIAAAEIADLYPRKSTHLITFGAPRYGDRRFVRESILKLADVARYVHGCDPVPFIPVFFSNYGMYWHLTDGRLVRKPDRAGVLGLLWSLIRHRDHAMQRYLVRLAEHL